jgi:DNA-binding response OmpR family regulator
VADSILIVEDDASILRGLQMNLGLEGFRIVAARDGEEAIKFARQHQPDLIVLDLMLPKKSGIDVIRELRVADPETPIVVLSAKDQEGDKVLALSLGADDYVTKPFGVAELIARIRAALRRRRRPERGGSFGDVTIDVEGRRILVGGVEVEATAREFDLLYFFSRHPNVAFTREQLMRQVWGPDHFGTVRTVDNFVARLRSKIEEDPEQPRHIETVRGIGYRFNP